MGWVYKILAQEKEVERMLYNDEDPSSGFLLNTAGQCRLTPG
jgi:hypothetical protein